MWFANPGQNQPSLFGPDGVQVRTSQQGVLGDCWFLSSATAVAETPARIHQVFDGTTEYTDTGAFNVFFYVRGERVAVHVDDRIPFEYYGPDYQYQYNWINNRVSYDGAWWLVILEKAFAKLMVNYSNINGGHPCDALRALTNDPCIQYEASTLSEVELWDLIVNGENKNYTMVGGTGNSPNDNVAPGHAETVLGTQVLRNADGSVHEYLVKMRNPWGRYQYDGPWSRKSDLWTPAFKQQADFDEADDGIFYTPLNLWKSEYQRININHTQKWQVEKLDGDKQVYASSQQRHQWITFNNPVEQDVMVECDQYNSRYWPLHNNQCSAQKDYPQQYQAYLFKGEENYYHQDKTTPAQIMCSGGAFKLDNLAPGEYNIGVWNFDGSANGHNIWQMRTFGEKQSLPLRDRPDLTARNQQ